MLKELDIVYDRLRHLACIPYSLENLHEAAKQVGINRCWFDRDHYDIPQKCIERIKQRSDCREIRPREMLKIVRK
jgi:FMN phosphatase YigB (HAD superfamily)